MLKTWRKKPTNNSTKSPRNRRNNRSGAALSKRKTNVWPATTNTTTTHTTHNQNLNNHKTWLQPFTNNQHRDIGEWSRRARIAAAPPSPLQCEEVEERKSRWRRVLFVWPVSLFVCLFGTGAERVCSWLVVCCWLIVVGCYFVLNLLLLISNAMSTLFSLFDRSID